MKYSQRLTLTIAFFFFSSSGLTVDHAVFHHGKISFLTTGFIKFYLSSFFCIFQGNMSSKLNCLVHNVVPRLKFIPIRFSFVYVLRRNFEIYTLAMSCIWIVTIIWSLDIVWAFFSWSLSKSLVSIKFEIWNLNVRSMHMREKVSCVIICSSSWHIEWQ